MTSPVTLFEPQDEVCDFSTSNELECSEIEAVVAGEKANAGTGERKWPDEENSNFAVNGKTSTRSERRVVRESQPTKATSTVCQSQTAVDDVGSKAIEFDVNSNLTKKSSDSCFAAADIASMDYTLDRLNLNGLSETSLSTEDALKDLHCMLGSTLSKSSTFDRLLGNESRLSTVRKHMSLSMSTASTTLTATCSNSSSNWISGRGNSCLMSPTFSMADIAVVVPPILLADGKGENNPQISVHDNADPLSCSAEQQRTMVQDFDDSVVKHKDSVADTKSNPKSKRRTKSKTETVERSSNSKNFFPSSNDNFDHSCRTITNGYVYDDNEITNKEPVKQEKLGASSGVIGESLKDRMTSLDNSIAGNAESTACTCAVSDGLVNGDVSLKGTVEADGESFDAAEWKCVANSRSKQKRKQVQSQAAVAHAPSNPSFHPTRKQQGFEKKSRTTPPAPKQVQAQSSRTTRTIPSNHCASANQNKASLSSASSAPETRNTPGFNDQRCFSLRSVSFQDDASSKALKDIQATSQSSVIDQNQHTKSNSMVSVSDCENMSVGERNSNVPAAAASDATNYVIEESIADHKAGPEITAANDSNEVEANEAQPEENSQETAAPKLQGEELIRQLKNQLEYYFSRENLAQDPYLVSQMNVDGFVSIYTIANFNAIKKLTNDINEVIEALKASRLVEIDQKEEMVRPNRHRCSVILREIPEGVKKEEVTALFDDCPAKLTYCEYGGNTIWYVQFDSVSDAQAAYHYLRENVREFKGKPIMARIKTKSHHLNTYSCQTLSSNSAEPKEQLPTATSVQENQQAPVATPVDYIQSPPFFVAPPPFPAPHPGAPVAAISPSLLSRVAVPSPAVPVPSSGHCTTAAMTVNPPFVVSAAWPGFYPTDPAFMGTHLANPFLHSQYKPHSQSYYPAASNGNKPPSNSSGHRYTDYHKGVASQRNSYNQRKPSNSSFSQQQLQHGAASKSRYVLTTDPNPPNLVQDSMGHYVQSELGSTHVSHSLPNTHYLPAVNASFASRAPFVTPNANDSNIFLVPQPHVGILQPNIHPNRIGGPRRGPAFYQAHRHPNAYSHNDQMGSSSSGHRGRHPSGRSYGGYPSEISPRFLPKGVNQHHHLPNQYALVQLAPAVNEAGHGTRSSYSNRPNNGNSQQSDNSPPHHDDAHTESDIFHGDRGKEHYGVANSDANNNNRRVSGNARIATPPDQKNGSQPLGLEQRRNMRARRPRRNDEDYRAPSAAAVPSVPNTPFKLESNSFPPLPGAPEPEALQSSESSESRPAAADVVKGSDTVKAVTTPPEPNPLPSKKYSEVSSASQVSSHGPATPKSTAPVGEATKTTKKSEVKATSAVNTQPVADKHPPVGNKRAQSNAKPSGDKKAMEPTKQRPQHPRASSANSSPSQPSSFKKASAKDSKVASVSSAPAKLDPPSKSTPAPKTESARHSSDASEKKATSKESVSDEQDSASADSNERRPTYAEIAKTAKALQNGRTTSDSESGEENRSNPDDDSNNKDSEAKSSVDVTVEKAGKTSQGKMEKDVEPNKGDRRTASANGPSGRRNNEFESRRGGYWHHRQHYRDRDRNNDHRGSDRPRDRPFNGDRGHWEMRGRGYHRGRRSYYRDNRFRGNNGNTRPATNSHSPSER